MRVFFFVYVKMTSTSSSAWFKHYEEKRKKTKSVVSAPVSVVKTTKSSRRHTHNKTIKAKDTPPQQSQPQHFVLHRFPVQMDSVMSRHSQQQQTRRTFQVIDVTQQSPVTQPSHARVSPWHDYNILRSSPTPTSFISSPPPIPTTIQRESLKTSLPRAKIEYTTTTLPTIKKPVMSASRSSSPFPRKPLSSSFSVQSRLSRHRTKTEDDDESIVSSATTSSISEISTTWKSPRRPPRGRGNHTHHDNNPPRTVRETDPIPLTVGPSVKPPRYDETGSTSNPRHSTDLPLRHDGLFLLSVWTRKVGDATHLSVMGINRSVHDENVYPIIFPHVMSQLHMDAVFLFDDNMWNIRIQPESSTSSTSSSPQDSSDDDEGYTFRLVFF